MLKKWKLNVSINLNRLDNIMESEELKYAVLLQCNMEKAFNEVINLKDQLIEYCKEKGISRSEVKKGLRKLRKEWKKS